MTDTRTVTTHLVLPTVVRLPTGPVPAPASETGARSARSRERSDDDVVTREYRQGDALRRVHWRVTARQGELMVRKDEPQAGPRSRLVLDTQRSGYPDAAGRRGATSELFEWAVRFAASVAVHLDERGYAVDLVTPTALPDDAPRADGPAGVALGQLALVELDQDDPHCATPAGTAAQPVVAIASRPDPQTVRWMLAHRTSSASAPALAVLVDDDPGLLLSGIRTGSPTAPGRDDGRELETAEESFARAGWIVARVPRLATQAEAWAALASDRLDRAAARAGAGQAGGVRGA